MKFENGSKIHACVAAAGAAAAYREAIKRMGVKPGTAAEAAAPAAASVSISFSFLISHFSFSS